MSALVLTKVRGDSSRNEWCQIRQCSKSGSVKAEIMGWPAGRICTRHAKEWRATWDAMLEAEEAQAA